MMVNLFICCLGSSFFVSGFDQSTIIDIPDVSDVLTDSVFNEFIGDGEGESMARKIYNYFFDPKQKSGMSF